MTNNDAPTMPQQCPTTITSTITAVTFTTDEEAQPPYPENWFYLFLMV